MMNDSVLMSCNETELLSLANAQGLGRLRRGIPREHLIQLVRGEAEPLPVDYSETAQTRKLLEDFIQRYWEKCRSQLPGCNGRCTTFPCSEGRHALCFSPNKEAMVVR